MSLISINCPDLSSVLIIAQLKRKRKFWRDLMKRGFDFIICLLTGPIGLHRFLKGQSFYGLIYILSLGLFLYGSFSGLEQLPLWSLLATALLWLMDLLFILIKGRHFFFTQSEIEHYLSPRSGGFSDDQLKSSGGLDFQDLINSLNRMAENLDALEEPEASEFIKISAELHKILPSYLDSIPEDSEAHELIDRINDHLSIVNEFKEFEHFGILLDAIETSDTEIKDILATISEDEGYDDIEEYLDDNFESLELAQKFILGASIWSIIDYIERLNDFK